MNFTDPLNTRSFRMEVGLLILVYAVWLGLEMLALQYRTAVVYDIWLGPFLTYPMTGLGVLLPMGVGAFCAKKGWREDCWWMVEAGISFGIFLLTIAANLEMNGGTLALISLAAAFFIFSASGGMMVEIFKSSGSRVLPIILCICLPLPCIALFISQFMLLFFIE